MNPDDRPVNVRTSASAKDFWCRPRVAGEEPGNVSPDGKVVSQELRSFSVLQDIPQTAPYQLQDNPRRQLPPLRNSRSIERIVYKVVNYVLRQLRSVADFAMKRYYVLRHCHRT